MPSKIQPDCKDPLTSTSGEDHVHDLSVGDRVDVDESLQENTSRTTQAVAGGEQEFTSRPTKEDSPSKSASMVENGNISNEDFQKLYTKVTDLDTKVTDLTTNINNVIQNIVNQLNNNSHAITNQFGENTNIIDGIINQVNENKNNIQSIVNQVNTNTATIIHQQLFSQKVAQNVADIQRLKEEQFIDAVRERNSELLSKTTIENEEDIRRRDDAEVVEAADGSSNLEVFEDITNGETEDIRRRNDVTEEKKEQLEYFTHDIDEQMKKVMQVMSGTDRIVEEYQNQLNSMLMKFDNAFNSLQNPDGAAFFL